MQQSLLLLSFLYGIPVTGQSSEINDNTTLVMIPPDSLHTLPVKALIVTGEKNVMQQLHRRFIAASTPQPGLRRLKDPTQMNSLLPGIYQTKKRLISF